MEDYTEIIYGALLGLQITSAVVVLFNWVIGFYILMVACFGKGMLYQYEHFKKSDEKDENKKRKLEVN